MYNLCAELTSDSNKNRMDEISHRPRQANGLK